MARRLVGWAMFASGSVVVASGAFLAWSTWDSRAWGFADFSPTAAIAAGLGTVALVTGLVLLRGRPAFVVVCSIALGAATVVLAADLFARDAGGWLLGELDGWQGSDSDGASSLAPAWGLLVEGLVVISVAVGARRRGVRAEPRRVRTVVPS